MSATATARKYIDQAPTPTLTSAINGTATVITLSSLVGLPTAYPYFGTLDLGTSTAEVVQVTGSPGTNQLTIVRNANGLGVFSHSSSGTFDHTMVAADLQDANDHSVAKTGVHGVAGNVVGTSDAQTLTNKTLTSPTVNNGTLNTPTINSPSISNGTLTGSTLANGTINNATLDAATVSQVTPAGSITMYGGLTAPSGFLLCNGSAVSRTTYANLKSALTFTVTGTLTNGANNVNAVSDTSNFPSFGNMAVEGAGIPNGTTAFATGSSTLTLSNAATSNGTVTITVFPFGNGNSTSTFNVPNLKGSFPYGYSTSAALQMGTTGGSLMHAHPLSQAGYAEIADPTTGLAVKQVSGVQSWTADFVYSATRSADGTSRTSGAALGGQTDSAPALPPYVVVNYIIKT